MSGSSSTLGLSQGFSSILQSLRSSKGYSELASSEPTNMLSKVRLDPNAPIEWSMETYLVQTNASDNKALINSNSGHDDDENDKNDNENDQNQAIMSKSCRLSGVFLAAVSGFFFTLCSVAVKLVPEISPSEVLFFRALIQGLIALPLAISADLDLSANTWLIIGLQGLIGFLTVTCIFIGFARLAVGDAATIIFSSPVFVMMLSRVVLHEHCGLYRSFVVLVLMLGVFLIAKPPLLVQFTDALVGQQSQAQSNLDHEDDYDLLGYSAALSGTLLTASNFVCVRRLKEVHFSILILSFCLVSILCSLLLLTLLSDVDAFYFRFHVPERRHVVWIIVVGVAGFLGQSLLAVALRTESAGVVSVTRSLDIVVAYVIQILYFHQLPSWTSLLGALLVVSAVCIMAAEDTILSFVTTRLGQQHWL